MTTETGKRFGYVRRFSYPGERWHIVDTPPTVDGWDKDAPTLCGYRPWTGTWGTICASADSLKVCKRCERVRRRFEGAR